MDRLNRPDWIEIELKCLFLGQRFAMLEEKVVLSCLLRRFRFRYDMDANGPAEPCVELVLKPKNGMPLIISSR